MFSTSLINKEFSLVYESQEHHFLFPPVLLVKIPYWIQKKKSLYVLQSVGLKTCEIFQRVDIATELIILRNSISLLNMLWLKSVVRSLEGHILSQQDIKDIYLTASWPYSLPDNS